MEAVIGFVLGIATVILLKEYPACKPKRSGGRIREEEARERREYESVLTYNGDERG